MTHSISNSDQELFDLFILCELDPESFHHREHVQLAYILLTKYDLDDAYSLLKDHLIAFLVHNRVDITKYHETKTYAWMLAVRHFMEISEPMSSSEEFIKANEILLDKTIMYTHYSKELLNSEKARSMFVEPDIEMIPTS